MYECDISKFKYAIYARSVFILVTRVFIITTHSWIFIIFTFAGCIHRSLQSAIYTMAATGSKWYLKQIAFPVLETEYDDDSMIKITWTQTTQELGFDGKYWLYSRQSVGTSCIQSGKEKKGFIRRMNSYYSWQTEHIDNVVMAWNTSTKECSTNRRDMQRCSLSTFPSFPGKFTSQHFTVTGLQLTHIKVSICNRFMFTPRRGESHILFIVKQASQLNLDILMNTKQQ